MCTRNSYFCFYQKISDILLLQAEWYGAFHVFRTQQRVNNQITEMIFHTLGNDLFSLAIYSLSKFPWQLLWIYYVCAVEFLVFSMREEKNGDLNTKRHCKLHERFVLFANDLCCVERPCGTHSLCSAVLWVVRWASTLFERYVSFKVKRTKIET